MTFESLGQQLLHYFTR